jgi:hypothetical protein
MLELCSQMDSLATTKVGILWEDTDDRAVLGHHNATSSNDRDTGDLMVVDTANVDCAESAFNNMYVITGDATIGVTINKGSGSRSVMHRTDSVKARHVADRSVACTINRNLVMSNRIRLGVLASAVIRDIRIRKNSVLVRNSDFFS